MINYTHKMKKRREKEKYESKKEKNAAITKQRPAKK